MTCNLIDWHLAYSSGMIKARPSSINAAKRLKITGAMVVLIGVTLLLAINYDTRSTYFIFHGRAPTLSERVTHPVVLGFCGLFAGIGLIAPFTALWQRVRIKIGARGDVAILTFLFWPRVKRISQGAIESISAVLTEEGAVTKGRYRQVQWRWHVLLKWTDGEAKFLLCEGVWDPAIRSVPWRVGDFLRAFGVVPTDQPGNGSADP